MLTADLAISFQRGDSIYPRRLEITDESLRIAKDLIRIVAEHVNLRRAELNRALDEYVGTGTDYRILRGLIKLLVDACVFETGEGVEPAELRQKLFLKAKSHHPVTPDKRSQLIAELAEEMGSTTETIAASLYADLSDNQRLIAFEEPAPAELIAGYNLAQAQALLYRSVEMKLTVGPQDVAGYRQLFSAIKRYDLIHTIRGKAETGYQVTLSGPVSIFHRSQKYGVRMAVFLPALLACKRWRMRAEIESKRGRAFFELSSEQHQLPATIPFAWGEDANLTEKFLASWGRLGSDWQATACREVVDLGGTAFVPDIELANSEGRKIYIELFGFWTPRYLKERLEEFERGNFKNFILMVSDELRGSREAPTNLPPNVITYKTSPDARAVQKLVEQDTGLLLPQVQN